MQAVEGLFGTKLENPIVGGNFAPVSEEISAPQLEVIEGAVPADFPDGFYIRNGPNPRFPTTNTSSPFGRSVHHWFEGDGMLHQVRFQHGSASYQNRFIRGDAFMKEEAAGEPLGRPVIQTSPPAGLFNVIVNQETFGAGGKDVSNTNVMWHAGRLLAMAEGACLPLEICPKDLSVLGPVDFGAVDKLPSFTAHPKVDPKTGEAFYAAWSFAASQEGGLGIHVGTIGPDGMLKHSSPVPSADRNTFLHDVAITENYLVITDFPLTIDPARLLYSEEGMMSFQHDAPARIGLMPRGGSDVQHWFDVPNGYGFHLMNAFEDGDAVIVRGVYADSVDLDYYEWTADGSLDRAKAVSRFFAEGRQAASISPTLREWRLNVRSGSVDERRVGPGHFTDFPVINHRYTGRSHRFGYCACFDPEKSHRIQSGFPIVGGIEKYTFHDGGEVTTEERVMPENFAAQECAFVQRPGSDVEDDGWLLMFAYDLAAGQTEFHIIDAQNFSGPPVARLALPQRVPFGFHGCWVPDE